MILVWEHTFGACLCESASNLQSLISPPADPLQGLGIYPQQVNWLTASKQECRPKRELARPLWTAKCGPQIVGMTYLGGRTAQRNGLRER